ncbi:MAG TPA: sigma-70 family RNA polymerase sigma factor [Acidimicrobiia bacterium]|nr:sigma-70 family RNA polymerase sigma factor [Acidimicrobiia bacterium]
MDVGRRLDDTIRREGGRVLATLARLTRDIGMAEDAVQEAALAAIESWPVVGVPDNPAAWLTTTARNRALDRLRRERSRSTKEAEAMRGLLDGPLEPPDGRDDRLRLIFTCCHPALSPEARVALALRTVAGLTTTEIARAFLVPEPTMGQRISRAKRKIATARIPYRIPDDHELAERLPAVLGTLYVVFTTGHHAPAGPMDSRLDLADEAIRLGRLLVELMPDEPEVSGLLALMLATRARSAARLDPDGHTVLMADQDRTRWDHDAIAEAAAIVEHTLRLKRPGPLQVQAAIATLHGLAPSDSATDWAQIVDLYRILERMQPGSVTRVNRAVAEAKVFGPEHALALLAEVEEDGWHLSWATRAHLLELAGDLEGARLALDNALGLAMNDHDRALLEERRRNLG